MIFGAIILIGGALVLLASFQEKGRRLGFYPSAMLMYAGLAMLIVAEDVDGEALELPDAARKEVDRELGRLERMGPEGMEAQVIRTYLETICELPWDERTDERLDIAKASAILEEDHYGLKKPKERILEVYLNVVEFGPKVYGAGAASRLYFGKSAGELTAREAALLAAVLPNPKQFSPTRPSDYVRSRAAKIETAVDALGGPGYIAGQ